MSISAILLPLFVQVALTFVLLFAMGRSRLLALRGKAVAVRDVALGEPAWPEATMRIGNAFHNQLQVPLLFYVLVILAMLTRKADLVFVVLAWAFVASRLAHAYVHVATNHVPTRFRLFLAGVVILVAMWTLFAVQILASGTILT